MDEQPGPSSSSLNQVPPRKEMEDENLPGDQEETGEKQVAVLRSPKTNPMLPPEVEIMNTKFSVYFGFDLFCIYKANQAFCILRIGFVPSVI